MGHSSQYRILSGKSFSISQWRPMTVICEKLRKKLSQLNWCALAVWSLNQNHYYYHYYYCYHYCYHYYYHYYNNCLQKFVFGIRPGTMNNVLTNLYRYFAQTYILLRMDWLNWKKNYFLKNGEKLFWAIQKPNKVPFIQGYWICFHESYWCWGRRVGQYKLAEIFTRHTEDPVPSKSARKVNELDIIND